MRNVPFWSDNMDDLAHRNVNLAVFVIRVDDCFYRPVISFGFEYIPIEDVMYSLCAGDYKMQLVDPLDIDPGIALRIAILKNALHVNDARTATTIASLAVAHVADNNPNTSQISTSIFFALITAPTLPVLVNNPLMLFNVTPVPPGLKITAPAVHWRNEISVPTGKLSV